MLRVWLFTPASLSPAPCSFCLSAVGVVVVVGAGEVGVCVWGGGGGGDGGGGGGASGWRMPEGKIIKGQVRITLVYTHG